MKKFAMLIASTFFSRALLSQDVYFVNTTQSLIYLNPSFAGSSGAVRSQTAYRNQWPNLTGKMVTYFNATDAYIKAFHGGISASAMTDDVANGELVTSWYSLGYACHLQISEKFKLIPSIQASYFREVLDRNSVHFEDGRSGFLGVGTGFRYRMTYDVLKPPPDRAKANLDLNAGLLAEYSDFRFGIAVFNINQPDIGLQDKFQLPARFCAHASYNLRFASKSLLNFTAVCNLQKSQSLWMYTSYYCGIAFATFGLSNNQQFMGALGLQQKRLRIAYCYDQRVSKLVGNTAGSHELSISFGFLKRDESWKEKGAESL
jgi:type IX secretion system PorP/SprF family membrane protein